MFHLSIKRYCKTRSHRSYWFLSMFNLRCERHYRNLEQHIAGVQHDVNTSRKRRRRDADIRSAAHSSNRQLMWREKLLLLTVVFLLCHFCIHVTRNRLKHYSHEHCLIICCVVFQKRCFLNWHSRETLAQVYSWIIKYYDNITASLVIRTIAKMQNFTFYQLYRF